jgi:uncharacterized delta-60 repeat protein
MRSSHPFEVSANQCSPVRTPDRSLAAVWVALMLLGSAQVARAGDGKLDRSFGSGGQVQIDFNQSTDIAYAIAIQSDGKLVSGGTTYVNNDYTHEDFAVSRQNPDGTLDTTFGVGGLVTTDFPNRAAVISSVVVQPDGKILVAGGAFPQFTALGKFTLVRYNPDGSLDGSFGSGGIVSSTFPGVGSYAFALALQPDGKILAAGTAFLEFFTGGNSKTDFAIARYNPDGTPDGTFGIHGQLTTDFDGFSDEIFAILVQPDGKLVAVGSAVSSGQFYDFAAVRYLSNGTIDSSFGVGGKVRTDFGNNGFDQARAAALQPDGKILAAGFTIYNSGLSQPFALARYNGDGSIDSSFDGDGLLQIDFGSFSQTAYEVLLQPDGKILTAGYPNTESSDSDFLLARCNPDGSLDPTFGHAGKVRTSFGDLNGGAYGAVLQPDGKIVAAGFNATFTANSVEFALARYEGPCGSSSTYCTASTTSIPGCQAGIGATGSPSLGSPNGFTISSGNVPGGNLGICFFGDNGPAGTPFGTLGGQVCVQGPFFRSAPKPSGGNTGVCDGNYSFTLQDLINASPIITSGATIHAEIWARDPANPDGFLLSNGLQFSVCP